MAEMRETAFIMQNMSPRSTSSSDGLAIAWSCCEYLLSLKAYTIFATHMEALSEISTMYPNVKICNFQVDVKKKRLDFKLLLKEGLLDVPHYGLLLADVSGLPITVMEEAKRVTNKLMLEDIEVLQTYTMQHLPLQKEYRVVQRLLCLKHGDMPEEELRTTLGNLRENFTEDRLH